MKKSNNSKNKRAWQLLLNLLLLIITNGSFQLAKAQCNPTPNAAFIALSNYSPCVGSTITVQVSGMYLPNANWQAVLQYPNSSINITGNGNYTIPITTGGNVVVSIMNNINGCPTVYNSNVLTFSVLPGNKPTAQSDTVIRFCTGDNKFLFVSTPNAASTFQWKKNGTVVGTNNDTLFLNTMAATDTGSYKCYISSSTCGSDSSKTIKLKFGSIESQSGNLSLCTGSQGLLWVKAPSANNFVWKLNGVAIPNSNNDTLTINNYTTAQAGTYTCEASLNGGCLNTASFTITTNTNVTLFDFSTVIASYPMSGNANNAVSTSNNGTVNSGCTLTADRNGNINRAYDFNGTANGTINMGDITAMNGANVLSISGWFKRTNTNRNNEFYSKVIDSSGIYCRDYLQSNYTYNTFGNNTPAISPINTNWFHYTMTFSGGAMKVFVNGTLAAQFSNFAKPSIQSATGSSFILGDILRGGTTAYPSDNFIGQMDEINIFSKELNPVEIAALMNAPQFTQHPQNASLCAGNNLTLSVLAESPTASFQWQKNGVDIAGANQATFTKVNIQAADAGSYTCIVSVGCNRSISKAAVVTVSSNSITITSQPQAQSKCVGQSASFTVAATGGTGYQWKKNGANINGQTTATLNLSSVALSDTGTYVCEISGGSCGSLSSQSAYLSVSAIPTPTISGASAVCSGSAITLTANGGNTYAWSNSGGNAASATFSPTTATTYTVTASLGAGCTATATKTITIKQPTAGSYNQTICFGQSVVFNGISRSQSGAYVDTLVNLAGCDSFLTLNLTVRPQITKSIAQTVCFGGSTTFNGATLTQSGVFKDTLTSVTGCDSILTLTFTVRPRIATSITQPICNGSAITFNGQTITTAGTYLDTLTSVNGCDSFITLNVTIAQATASTVNKSACGSFSFGGNALTVSGTYLDTIPNTAGCDSVITLNLTINQATASTKNDTICFGTTYAFGSQTLSATGTYTRTIPNAVGCDSVITLNLFVRPAINISITQNGLDLTATAGFTDYFWKLNGANITAANLNTYTTTSNGAYSVQVVDVNNCSAISNTVNVTSVGIDDVSSLDLTIYPNPVNNVLHISSEIAFDKIQITNPIGDIIKEGSLSSTSINITELQAGVYFAKLIDSKGTIATKKFIKQ
jgi:hypothetical protein